MTLPLSYSRLREPDAPSPRRASPPSCRYHRSTSTIRLACQPKPAATTAPSTWWQAKAGGEGRIRTSEGARPTDLQSVAFDRSATSPNMTRSAARRPLLPDRHLVPGIPQTAQQCAAPGYRRLRDRLLGTLPGGPASMDGALDRQALFPWSWRRDSNPRPADYKSAALPD